MQSLSHNPKMTMINRSIDMIFETSGQPVPTEEEVQFEAQEIVQRSGWGLPLIERLKKIADPAGAKTMKAYYWKICGAKYDESHA